MAETRKRSSLAIVLLAWLVVCVPLGWGVYNTIRSSMKLFQPPPAQSAPVAPAK